MASFFYFRYVKTVVTIRYMEYCDGILSRFSAGSGESGTADKAMKTLIKWWIGNMSARLKNFIPKD